MLLRVWLEQRWGSVLPERRWDCGVHPVEADWESVAGMPENVNINTVSDAIAGRSGAAPTAFQAWEKECEDAIAFRLDQIGYE